MIHTIPIARFVIYEILLISFNSSRVMAKNVGQPNATHIVYMTPTNTFISDISSTTMPGSYFVLSRKYTTIIELAMNFEIAKYKNAIGDIYILPNVFLITVPNKSPAVLLWVHFCVQGKHVPIAVIAIVVNEPYT